MTANAPDEIPEPQPAPKSVRLRRSSARVKRDLVIEVVMAVAVLAAVGAGSSGRAVASATAAVHVPLALWVGWPRVSRLTEQPSNSSKKHTGLVVLAAAGWKVSLLVFTAWTGHAVVLLAAYAGALVGFAIADAAAVPRLRVLEAQRARDAAERRRERDRERRAGRQPAGRSGEAGAVGP